MACFWLHTALHATTVQLYCTPGLLCITVVNRLLRTQESIRREARGACALTGGEDHVYGITVVLIRREIASPQALRLNYWTLLCKVFSEVSYTRAPARGGSVAKFSFGTTRVVAFIVLGQFPDASCDPSLVSISFFFASRGEIIH